jgi:hypothetical protein
MALILGIVSFMIFVMVIGKKVERMQWKHYLFISFVVFLQLAIALVLVFTKQRPPTL